MYEQPLGNILNSQTMVKIHGPSGGNRRAAALETASVNRVNVRKRWNYNRRAHAAPRASRFGLDGDSNLKSRS
jgi:hypothetical protein